jgi:hypothetical protein
MNDSKTTTIARINQVDILLIENGEKRVAIKPICEVLGVTIQGQLDKLKSDPILSSVIKLSLTTGADGKQYEMVTIPFKYVFGWLFRIDSRNVKEEAREAVLSYQVKCYDVLYSYFTSYADFVEKKQQVVEQKLSIFEEASDNFANAKNIMQKARTELRQASKLQYEDYDAERRQLKIFSEEEMGVVKQ